MFAAGWFQIAQGKGPEKDDERHHATIESISSAGCEYFLTRTQIAAFSGLTNIDGKLELHGEVKLYPGEIIKVEACIGRRWKARGDDGDKKKQHETKFLKCTDFHGRELYLPYAHPGIFHAVVEDDVNLDDPSVVYQLEDLLKQEKKLPMVVKLIFGWPPKKSVEFHGYLRLLYIRRPDTFVIHGFGSTEQSFAEIPLNIDWRVQSLLNIGKLKGSAMFNDTMERCRDKVYPFLTSIKTLTIQYKCLDDGDGDNDDEDGPPRRRKSSGNKAIIDRLTDPVDMSNFNPLNIYPPATDLDDGQDNVSESWSLSFRDPKPVSPVSKHLYEHKDNVIGEEEPWVMAEEGSASGQGSMVRIGQQSAMYKQENKRGSIASFTNDTNERIKKNDLRVIKDRSKSQREAKC